MTGFAATAQTLKTQLNREGYIAEIVFGRASGLYHYVITKEDSPEILAWGQENTAKAAQKSIGDFIYFEKQRKKTAG